MLMPKWILNPLIVHRITGSPKFRELRPIGIWLNSADIGQ
jgi:hypothetical protein